MISIGPDQPPTGMQRALTCLMLECSTVVSDIINDENYQRATFNEVVVEFMHRTKGRCNPVYVKQYVAQLFAQRGLQVEGTEHLPKLVYVVGSIRHADRAITRKPCWTLHGVFVDEGAAENACLDHHYFIAPVTLDAATTFDPVTWEGLYWPKAGDI